MFPKHLRVTHSLLSILSLYGQIIVFWLTHPPCVNRLQLTVQLQHCTRLTNDMSILFVHTLTNKMPDGAIKNCDGEVRGARWRRG